MRIASQLDGLEADAGMTPGATRILVVATETPSAMFNLGGYAPAHPRLAGLTWGAEDLSAAVGAATNKGPDGDWSHPYQLARSLCLFAAAAAEVAPIETLYADFRDTEGLTQSCKASRRDGFTGRIAIHPDQVAPINACFSPSQEDLAHARRVVEAFDAEPDAGTIGIDGKMYDIPHLKAARRILASDEDASVNRSPRIDPADELDALRGGVRAVVTRFGDDYWLARDDDGEFPFEFHRAMAAAGWLGITMPEEFGGSGLGVTEAAVMMHEVASHGGGMTATSAIHINLFGPHPIVVHGTPEQKGRWIPRLVAGEDQCCFGFTEPDAGLDTTRIKTFADKVDGGYMVRGQKVWTSTAQVANKVMLLTRTTKFENAKRPTDGITIFYTDLDRSKIEVRRIPKMGRKAVDSNAIFIDGLFIPEADRIGEEGTGFSYILDSLNPERILIAVEAIGIGQDALRRASNYARERIVFDRPIGQNQGIQHPLAERWMYLESAWLMAMRAASLYDSGKPCGAEANSAKFLGARAGYDACLQAVLTHGGFGYAREYHVERLLREVLITRIAPITEQLILSFIAEKVLDQPKSY